MRTPGSQNLHPLHQKKEHATTGCHGTGPLPCGWMSEAIRSDWTSGRRGGVNSRALYKPQTVADGPSTYPTVEVSGSKNNIYGGFADQKPLVLGTWTSGYSGRQ